jgi:hypothetical protein
MTVAALAALLRQRCAETHDMACVCDADADAAWFAARGVVVVPLEHPFVTFAKQQRDKAAEDLSRVQAELHQRRYGVRP